QSHSSAFGRSTVLRPYRSSDVRSLIRIPSCTISLQEIAERLAVPSPKSKLMRQYWHSSFQQKLPYEIASGARYWKQRNIGLFSGTSNSLPRIVIFTNRVNGR